MFELEQMKMRHTSFLLVCAAALGSVHCASENAGSGTAASGSGDSTEAMGGQAPPAVPPVNAEPSPGPPPTTDGSGSEGGPLPVGGITSGGVAAPGTSTPPVTNPPPIATPPTLSDGCSGGSLEPGDHDETLEHAGVTRQFIVHVPASYDGSAPVPLVLDIHGLTSSARAQAGLSGWRQKSDEVGFIVVHPNGLNASWNGGELCCGSSLDAQVDDEGFMRAIVARLESEACIDPRRVYATGLSNGGAMAHLLACRAADVFAATAPVSMGNGAGTCEPSRPISVIMTRGTRDPLVSYTGGLFPGADEDFENWSEVNGCSGAPTPSGQLCETHASCSGGVEVTLCSLDAGHVLYDNSDNFSVPDVVWEAFARQTLP